MQGGSNGSPITNRDLNNFGPFAGIAYSPFSDSKTVIRAHFAQHYVQDGFTFWDAADHRQYRSVQHLLTTAPPRAFLTPTGLPLPTPTPASAGFPVSQVANLLNTAARRFGNRL